MEYTDFTPGDGVDVGITTGEQFGQFVYWAVKTHPKDQFPDDLIQTLIRDEFPYRTDRRKWPNNKDRTYQSIQDQRNYANQPFELGKNSKLGIKDEQHGKEVIARIAEKMLSILSRSDSPPGSIQKSSSFEASNSFITSRGTTSEDWAEVEETPWFNMWSRRQWPYLEINLGDTLYWYSASRQAIVWKTSITSLERFEYGSKDEARTKLLKLIDSDPASDPYFVEAAEQGYCLFYRVIPIEKLDLPKPVDWSFPRLAWLRGTEDIVMKWLNPVAFAYPYANLSPIASDIGDPPSQRAICSIYRILRDTELARRIKNMHEFHCQICRERIELQGGTFYAEAHHLKPLGSPHDGPDRIENVVCVCPNHHAALDYGAIRIDEDTFHCVEGHSLDSEFIDYHNQYIFGR